MPPRSNYVVMALLILAALSSAAAAARSGHGGGGGGGHHGGGGHGGGGGRHHRGGVLAKSISQLIPDVVVDKRGGGGNVTTIGQALSRSVTAPRGAARPYFVIYITEGTYEEHLLITAKNVVLIGDGMSTTVITGNRSRNTGHDTEQSATVTVKGDGFMARDLGIYNTAGGPDANQAVAFLSEGDKSVLYRCGFRGFQDTLFAKTKTQFYRDCHIWGTVDFIFGDAAAVFQDCFIFARPPSSKGQPDVLTAQGRLDHGGSSGFVFHNCTVMASTLQGEKLESGVVTYLGRPWKHHARTVFLMSAIDSIIHADGWVNWNKTKIAGGEQPMPDHENHIFYAEYKNHRLGGSVNETLHWNGFYSIKNDSEAQQFTPGKFINGDAWLPRTGVHYYPGLDYSA